MNIFRYADLIIRFYILILTDYVLNIILYLEIDEVSPCYKCTRQQNSTLNLIYSSYISKIFPEGVFTNILSSTRSYGSLCDWKCEIICSRLLQAKAVLKAMYASGYSKFVPSSPVLVSSISSSTHVIGTPPSRLTNCST